MNWPTAPPSMPVPGWYVDPDQPTTWRWWDGTQWTPHRSPMWQPTPRDPTSFSGWFEASTEVVKAVVRRVGVLVLLAYLVSSAALLLVVYRVVQSAEGREIRDLLDLDDDFGGTEGGLTDAEADRVVDLLGDIAWGWAPWFVLLTIAMAVAYTWSFTLVARLAAAIAERQTARRREVPDTDRDPWSGPLVPEGPRPGSVDDPLGRASSAALRRTFPVMVSYLAVGALLIGSGAVLLGPMFVALVAGADGAVIALTATFGGLAAVVLIVWLAVRLSLAPVIAAVGGHGLGLGRSWALTQGHFWGVVGRLVVASLIAGVASAPLNFLGNLGFLFGLIGTLVMIVVLQSVASAASVLINASAQAVIVEHLGAGSDAESLAAGR